MSLPSRFCRCLVLVGVVFCAMGCVHRRLTIDSSPPGALVEVDGEEIGYAPASVDFTYYGTREIKLRKDGYQTLTVHQKIPAPWYQRFPLDFFSDNFLFGKVHDRHRFHYQLQPTQEEAAAQGLMERAGSLRSESTLGR